MTDDLTDYFDRYLPKWPAMFVYGARVETEQAKEIIRRTDTFFYYPDGKDSKFLRSMADNFGWRVDRWSMRSLNPDRDKHTEILNQWLVRWEYIELEYIRNDWISSLFVYGPNGWCHPDGIIQYAFNVGKWPSVEDLYNEWSKVAEAFPFLSLRVQLHDRESTVLNTTENTQVVAMEIENGKVKFLPDNIPPFSESLYPHFARPEWPSPATLAGTGTGTPVAWLAEWGEKSRAIFKEIL